MPVSTRLISNSCITWLFCEKLYALMSPFDYYFWSLIDQDMIDMVPTAWYLRSIPWLGIWGHVSNWTTGLKWLAPISSHKSTPCPGHRYLWISYSNDFFMGWILRKSKPELSATFENSIITILAYLHVHVIYHVIRINGAAYIRKKGVSTYLDD